MGLSWSTTHHFYVHHVENPRSQRVKKEVVLNVGSEEEFPFTSLVAPMPSTQKAVIVSIHIHMVRNELPEDVTVRLCNVWPGDHDSINILCPREYTRIFKDEAESCVYSNPLEPSIIELYAGLDSVLLCNSATAIDDDDTKGDSSVVASSPLEQECYTENHPLVQFILQHEKILNAVDGDIVRKSAGTDSYFLVRSAFAERVREFFRNTVLDDLRTTRFDKCTLEYQLPDQVDNSSSGTKTGIPASKGLMLILEIDYVLINAGSGSLHHVSQEIT